MILTPKKEFAIRLFCIAVLLTLCILVYSNGRQLDCNNCVINFEASRRGLDTASNEPFQSFSVKILDLYTNLTEEDECLVEFDKMQGYYLKGDLGFQLNSEINTEVKPQC